MRPEVVILKSRLVASGDVTADEGILKDPRDLLRPNTPSSVRLALSGPA